MRWLNLSKSNNAHIALKMPAAKKTQAASSAISKSGRGRPRKRTIDAKIDPRLKTVALAAHVAAAKYMAQRADWPMKKVLMALYHMGNRVGMIAMGRIRKDGFPTVHLGSPGKKPAVNNMADRLYLAKDRTWAQNGILVTQACKTMGKDFIDALQTFCNEHVMAMITPTFEDGIGWGLCAAKDLPAGIRIPGVIIHDCPKRIEHFDSGIAVGDNVSDYNLYGPMALMNAACSQHANCRFSINKTRLTAVGTLSKRVACNEQILANYHLKDVATCCIPGCKRAIRGPMEPRPAKHVFTPAVETRTFKNKKR